MATREEILSLLKSNDENKVRDGLFKTKWCDGKLHYQCMNLLAICGWSIKDFTMAMSNQKCISFNVKGEMLNFIKYTDLEELNNLLEVEVSLEVKEFELFIGKKVTSYTLNVNHTVGN